MHKSLLVDWNVQLLGNDLVDSSQRASRFGHNSELSTVWQSNSNHDVLCWSHDNWSGCWPNECNDGVSGQIVVLE